MVILISGSSHTGKTALAQKLLKKYEFPYLSQDHLKMGLIRSGFSTLTPEDDIDDIIHVLWPITREIIKTCIENKQNLIIEGCYIPFDYKNDFKDDYLKYIKYNCLIFSSKYIKEHYEDIMKHASTIEYRDENDAKYCTKEMLLRENLLNLERCIETNSEYTLIDDRYAVDIEL
ncbi:adenylate kinase [Lachnoclostridium phytofermentans]|uniref:Adenylate kinase n=1 Tax=Lachnoclostridium phytofermentans (strain ATCC 700394 / DSM 18823 / ISDg) TaxID=357809 RepID=A9KRQ5_LACP7|nr:adenylate kinase [Lachnoclostridium phytofermentans]ABX43549.1 conserved hypothetical protein [Lachnoclostridium phytofermentans ISDg]